MVTQPSLPLSSSLQCRRVTPSASLILGGSSASTTSSSSSFVTVLLVPISKVSVTEMLWAHMKRSRKMSSNSFWLISPFLSASMCLNRASFCSSEKVRSSRANCSGSLSRKALKALGLALPSLATSLKRDCFVAPFFCICSLQASTRSNALFATRKVAPPSATRAPAVSVALSISPSTSPTISPASASNFLATNFCSRSLAAFFDLVSSTWMPLRRL
mmetsp:Transcript_30869/g.70171  ORF Transcript_30869/g.70171 Transcript_30869/m.70171 type:complete len:217 (+) Transcript_30869:2157-2807(+)